jgi:hypothetical protein
VLRGNYNRVATIAAGTWPYLEEVDRALAEGRRPPLAKKHPLGVQSMTAARDGTVTVDTADDTLTGGQLVFKRTAGADGKGAWSCSVRNIRLIQKPPECKD